MKIKDIRKEIEKYLTAGYPAVAIYHQYHYGDGIAEIIRSVDDLGNIDNVDDLEIFPLEKGKSYYWVHIPIEWGSPYTMETFIKEFKEPEGLIHI